MVSLNSTVTPAQAGKALKVANVDRANGNRGRIQPVSSAKEPSVDVKLCLVFPREALSVPVMRHMLGDALRGLGADDDGLAELLLAVTEACTNVVRHGGPGRRYEVVASLGSRGCRIEVQNTWPGFAGGRIPGLRRRPWPGTTSPVRPRRRGGRPATLGRSLLRAGSASGAHTGEAATEEDIAALPESGRGIDIMRACVDDVSMTSGPEHRTVVSLSKRLAWRPGAPFAGTLDGELEDGQLADAG
jgi:serine/threonine-protein kinase RsbW